MTELHEPTATKSVTKTSSFRQTGRTAPLRRPPSLVKHGVCVGTNRESTAKGSLAHRLAPAAWLVYFDWSASEATLAAASCVWRRGTHPFLMESCPIIYRLPAINAKGAPCWTAASLLMKVWMFCWPRIPDAPGPYFLLYSGPCALCLVQRGRSNDPKTNFPRCFCCAISVPVPVSLCLAGGRVV